MNRRLFLGSLAAAGAPLVRSQQRPPNIVLIVADDMGWGDASINGCPDIRTPHIDSIAEDGVRFTRSYASAPECTPTRTALLTGRYQQRVGGLECAIGVKGIGRYDEAAWLQERGELGLPASERTLSRVLKEHGYDTALFGKWHLGYQEKFWPDKHGFDSFFGILGGNADYYTHEEQLEGLGTSHLYENGRKVERSGYLTDLFAEAAVDWLKKRGSDPFFIYLPFNAPHTPIQAAEEFDPETGTAPHRPRHRPTYVKMMERLDTRIGDVLGQLEAMGATEDTIVIFHSDNGADANGRNAPFRGRKSSVWEGGLRSPLHIRWPRLLHAGTVTNQVALSMDLMPTLMSAAGVLVRRVDGDDLLPVLTGTKRSYPRTVFWRYRRAGNTRKAVRHGDWKYLEDGEIRGLYDLAQDAGEEANHMEARPDVVKNLRARLDAWEREVRSPRLRDYRPGTA